MTAQPYLIALLAGLALVALTVLGFVMVVVTATAVSKRRAPSPLPSTDELARRAGELLVETDDALDTSAQALGFAEAEFGEDAAKPFREALERAHAGVAEAFREYQRLGSLDVRERVAVLADVVRRCELAGSELARFASRFEELRERARHAPEVASSVEAAVEASAERARGAEAALERLHGVYAASVLAPVEHAPERAREHLRRASTRTAEARAAIRFGDVRKAAALLGEAEEATEEAVRLLDAVDETAEGLEAERARLTVGLAEIHRTG